MKETLPIVIKVALGAYQLGLLTALLIYRWPEKGKSPKPKVRKHRKHNADQQGEGSDGERDDAYDM